MLVSSQEQYQIDLIGPTRLNHRWQAQEGKGFAADNFVVDWQQQVMTCPEGKTSASWTPAMIKIKFSTKDCSVCPSLSFCTQNKRQRRTVTIRPESQYKALQIAREREKTIDYKQEDDRRAGIEGTLSQGIRAHGLRRARYMGLAKTHLQHLMTATAINVKRIFNGLCQVPHATTQVSQYARLMAQAAG